MIVLVHLHGHARSAAYSILLQEATLAETPASAIITAAAEGAAAERQREATIESEQQAAESGEANEGGSCAVM